MEAKNDKILSRSTWALMAVVYIVPLLVVRDIDKIQNSKVILVYLVYLVLTTVIPLLLPKIIVDMFLQKNSEEDKYMFRKTKDLLVITYLIAVFFCSLFFYVLLALPRQY